MKKILLIIAIAIVGAFGYFSLFANDYKEARAAADAGDYQKFYSLIKDDVASGDGDAKEILMDYAIGAVQNNKLNEIKYLLTQDSKLINEENKDGVRLVDVALIPERTKKVNMDMLNLLMSHNPELNHKINEADGCTLVQLISGREDLNNKKDIFELLLKHGADIELYDKTETKKSNKVPPLSYAYISGNFEFFELLATHSKELNPRELKGSLLGTMLGLYLLEIDKKHPNMEIHIDKLTKMQMSDVLTSDSYKTLHQKNIRYLEVLLKNGLLDKVEEGEIKNLAVFYAVVGEMDALTLLKKYGLCKFGQSCKEAAQRAGANGNIAVVELISK